MKSFLIGELARRADVNKETVRIIKQLKKLGFKLRPPAISFDHLDERRRQHAWLTYGYRANNRMLLAGKTMDAECSNP